jgi:hypothetical protein
MVKLELAVVMQVEVSEVLNEKLENGDPEAFLFLERQLNHGLTKGGIIVLKLQIEDAGPHNVVFSDDHPSKPNWTDFPAPGVCERGHTERQSSCPACHDLRIAAYEDNQRG